jgi:hypothetical protein
MQGPFHTPRSFFRDSRNIILPAPTPQVTGRIPDLRCDGRVGVRVRPRAPRASIATASRTTPRPQQHANQQQQQPGSCGIGLVGRHSVCSWVKSRRPGVRSLSAHRVLAL